MYNFSMELNIKTWAVVALLGAAQGIILSLLLFFFNKTNGKVNKILVEQGFNFGRRTFFSSR